MQEKRSGRKRRRGQFVLRLEQAGWVFLPEPSYWWGPSFVVISLPTPCSAGSSSLTPAHRPYHKDAWLFELIQAYWLPAVTHPRTNRVQMAYQLGVWQSSQLCWGTPAVYLPGGRMNTISIQPSDDSLPPCPLPCCSLSFWLPLSTILSVPPVSSLQPTGTLFFHRS